MMLRAGVIGAVCAFVTGCGRSSGPAPQAQPSPSAGPPAQTLTVSITGAGTVRSAPSGIDCGPSCSAPFAEGVAVALTAAPAAGSVFAGWSGACTGAGACSVTMSADMAVAARFELAPPPPPPPPAGMHSLTVTTSGQGTVTSTPAGIDCGAACTANFADGAQVKLAAAASSGWSFAGFSGACNGADCTLTMSADAGVGATFTQNPPPPPPPDECDGLMPAALPAPVVATLPQNSCLDGTSDDGSGNYLLGYTAGGGPTYPNYLFFTIQGGKAVRIGDTVPGGDESGTWVYSQPSGFTAFHVSGFSGGSGLDSYDHDGLLRSSAAVVVASPNGRNFPSSAVGIDPSGGTVMLRHFYADVQGWVTAVRRLDKTGMVEAGDVVVDNADHPAGAIGVALSGHSLALVSQSPGTWMARWLARDGTPLTGWFTLQGPTLPSVRFLMDGGVLVGFGNAYSGVAFAYRIADGAARAEPLPDWLAQRSNNMLFAIRNGRGYASWGRGGKCSDGQATGSLEVLAASGKSCGCLRVPGLSASGPNNYARYSTVGRDGSLIVPNAAVNFGTCQYDLYPQLLK